METETTYPIQPGQRIVVTERPRRWVQGETEGYHAVTTLVEVTECHSRGFEYTVCAILSEDGRPSFATGPRVGESTENMRGSVAWFAFDLYVERGTFRLVD